MPTLSPAASALDGTESLELRIEGRFGGLITMRQLLLAATGFPIGPGEANAPVGLPAVTSVKGTEQVQVFTAATGGWEVATLAQVMAWATTGTIAAFALPADGAGLGGLPDAATFADTDAVMIRQGGGAKAMTFGQLRAWMPRLALSGALAYAVSAPAGTVVATIVNVPAGVTPAVASPTDGTLVIAPAQGGGWNVVTGSTPSTVGTVTLSVAAIGAVGASAPVTSA